MKNKLFKWVRPLLPILVLVLLIAAKTNFGRLVLSETPEIIGSSGDSLSNSTAGTWDFGGADLATTGGISLNDKIDAGIVSGINHVGVALTADSIDVSGITINDAGAGDRTLCFITLFRDVPSISGSEDSLIYVVSVDTNASGANIFILSFEIAPLKAKGEDTLWYNYLIME